jgi:hypothetical protein
MMMMASLDDQQADCSPDDDNDDMGSTGRQFRAEQLAVPSA